MPSRDQVLDFIEKNVHGYAKSTEQLLIEYLNNEINFNKKYSQKIFDSFDNDWFTISENLKVNCVETITWNVLSSKCSLLDHDEFSELENYPVYNKLLREFHRTTFIIKIENNLFQFIPYTIEHVNLIINSYTTVLKTFWKARKFLFWFIKNENSSRMSQKMNQLEQEFFSTFN